MTKSAAWLRPAGIGAARGQRRGWGSPVALVIAATTVLALALRMYQLSRPGFLMGVIEYDDGTDFGGAIRLVHGLLPYRDFIIVQPPGILLLMAPIALAAKSLGAAGALAIGRVLTVLASAAGVTLTGLLVRHRGVLATLIACGVLAVYPDSVAAAKTVLLEPWLVLFCLLGALAVFDAGRLAGSWRLLAGGLAFGFAGAVKVWAIIPVAVILVLTLLRQRPQAAGAEAAGAQAAGTPAQPGRPGRPPELAGQGHRVRRAVTFAAGVAAGFAVPVLPFAALAPRTFYDSVVVAQLLRVDVIRIPLGQRLTDMTGLSHLSSPPGWLLAILVAVILALTIGVSGLATRLTRVAPSPLEWFTLGTFVLIVAAFLWPADFYYHYPAFLAPFLGMAIGVPLARLLPALRALPAAGRPRLLRGRMSFLLGPRVAMPVAGVLLTVFAALQFGAEAGMAAAVRASSIAAARHIIKPGACVLTDQVSYLMAADRFVSRDPRCSPMVDGVGTDYALSLGHNGVTGAGNTPQVRAVWMSAFKAAQYVWLTDLSNRRIPWTPQLQNYFASHFTPVIEGPDWLYVRTSGPGVHG